MYEDIFELIIIAAQKRNLKESTSHRYCQALTPFLKAINKPWQELSIEDADEMVKLFCNTKQDKDTLINVGFFFQMVLSNHLRNVDVYGYNIHIHILPLPD